MRKFIKGKGAEKSAPLLIEVNIDANCGACFAIADQVYYNKEKKVLLIICPNEHRTETAGNWEWLING